MIRSGVSGEVCLMFCGSANQRALQKYLIDAGLNSMAGSEHRSICDASADVPPVIGISANA
jgi:hypothetical protein